MSEYVTDLLHTRRIKKRLPGKTNLDLLLSVPQESADYLHINKIRSECIKQLSVPPLHLKNNQQIVSCAKAVNKALAYVNGCSGASSPQKLKEMRRFYNDCEAVKLFELLASYEPSCNELCELAKNLRQQDAYCILNSYKYDIPNGSESTLFTKLNRQQSLEIKSSYLKELLASHDTQIDRTAFLYNGINQMFKQDQTIFDTEDLLSLLELKKSGKLDNLLLSRMEELEDFDDVKYFSGTPSEALRERVISALTDPGNSKEKGLNSGMALLGTHFKLVNDPAQRSILKILNEENSMHKMLSRYSLKIVGCQSNAHVSKIRIVDKMKGLIQELAKDTKICWDEEDYEPYSHAYADDIIMNGGTIIAGVAERSSGEYVAFCRSFIGIDKHGKKYLHIDIIEGKEYAHGPLHFEESGGSSWPFWIGLSAMINLGTVIGLDYVAAGDAGVSEIFKWLDFKSIETRRRYGMYKIGLGQSSSPEDSSEDFAYVCIRLAPDYFQRITRKHLMHRIFFI